MQYWNRDNFDGLAALASEFRRDSRLEHLARYCELRERGLRPQALEALEEFIAAARSSETSVQRELALGIADANWRTPGVHQFLTHPLRTRFLEPVLDQWCDSEPENPQPISELALLRHDAGLLGRALALDPHNERVRAALLSLLLGDVDYATHHLVEGRLIGTLDEAQATLREADDLLRSVTEQDRFAEYRREAAEYRQLLADWAEYCVQPVGTFPEWCRERGRTYGWPSIVYYDQ